MWPLPKRLHASSPFLIGGLDPSLFVNENNFSCEWNLKIHPYLRRWICFPGRSLDKLRASWDTLERLRAELGRKMSERQEGKYCTSVPLRDSSCASKENLCWWYPMYALLNNKVDKAPLSLRSCFSLPTYKRQKLQWWDFFLLLILINHSKKV